MWNNVINAWWPLVFYPATDAPWFTKGAWAMIGTAIATLGITAVVWWLERREKRVRGRRSYDDPEPTQVEEKAAESQREERRRSNSWESNEGTEKEANVSGI